MSVREINKLSDNKFLNLYQIEVFNEKKGIIYPYYVASRRKKTQDLACVSRNHNKADAVMMVPMYENFDVVLIKQYRPAIDDYIYEFPAGLVDLGESTSTAVRRELYEEIGVETKYIEQIIKPSYTSVGMSDETCAVYIATVEGELSTEHNEGHEDIEPIVLKIDDALQFIKDNNVSIKTALVLRSLYYQRRFYCKQGE